MIILKYDIDLKHFLETKKTGTVSVEYLKYSICKLKNISH